ncbi:hypothetical protein C8R43DRAFT_947778 [Mycena crocata]|nr:hypothetical protein C8R43DRAFT_947778 [Mycena crocata]
MSQGSRGRWQEASRLGNTSSHIPRIMRFTVSSTILFVFALLRSNVQVDARFTVEREDEANSNFTLSRRTLSSATFDYDWSPNCCVAGDSACSHGSATISLTATASTGNGDSAELSLNGLPFTNGFDGKQHCDSGGIICWSGTPTNGDKSANVCVHYANDQICKDADVTQSGNCPTQNVHIGANLP